MPYGNPISPPQFVSLPGEPSTAYEFEHVAPKVQPLPHELLTVDMSLARKLAPSQTIISLPVLPIW